MNVTRGRYRRGEPVEGSSGALVADRIELSSSLLV